jgi:hypothetical protein
VYVEPFLGGAAVMRHKRAARWNYGIDLDAGAISRAADLVTPPGPPPWFDIQRGCGIEWLEAWDPPAHPVGTAFVYCDPPYLRATRRGQRPMYRYELSDQDHERLLSVLLRLRCMVLVSGYWSELYSTRLAGWISTSFETMTHRGRAREFLWYNYPTPVELHDYRYLGDTYRERERIRRKQRRWAARLAAMPAAERQALLAVLQGLGV